MNIQELENLLKDKGFEEKKQDTGMEYTLTDGHVKLICYVEPGVEVEFISLYRWKNNEVKGTYNLSVKDMEWTKDSVQTMFRKTKNNIPQHIGETIDVHEEVERVVNRLS